MTTLTKAEEACSCGCACCNEQPQNSEAEVVQLTTLRQAIDKRLTELGA